MQEVWIWSLGQEDPLAVMSTHSSVLAWRIPRPEEPSGLLCLGLQSVSHDWVQHSTKINDVCCFQPIPIRADHWEVKHHTHTSTRTEATYSISVFLAYTVQELLRHAALLPPYPTDCPWRSGEGRRSINILAWNRSPSHSRCPGADVLKRNMGTEA